MTDHYADERREPSSLDFEELATGVVNSIDPKIDAGV
jgi:hypothetical protein